MSGAHTADLGVPEEMIVIDAINGNARAFSELYRRYHGYIRKMLAEEVRDVEARQDIAQSAFERAWTRLDTLRDPAAFRPWLAQITRRLISDYYRSVEKIDLTVDPIAIELPSDDWSAYDWASMRELAAALQIAVRGLSARDASVLELASTFGFDATEIAAALNVDPGHARVLLHRARKRLGKELLDVHEGALA